MSTSTSTSPTTRSMKKRISSPQSYSGKVIDLPVASTSTRTGPGVSLAKARGARKKEMTTMFLRKPSKMAAVKHVTKPKEPYTRSTKTATTLAMTSTSSRPTRMSRRKKMKMSEEEEMAMAMPMDTLFSLSTSSSSTTSSSSSSFSLFGAPSFLDDVGLITCMPSHKMMETSEGDKMETSEGDTKKMAAESRMTKPKPFKVCDVGRSVRVGLAAKTLEELKTKIQRHFRGVDDEFDVVLEADCTVIENDEYFQTLADNTAIMVVGKGQTWTRASSSLGLDFVEVDGRASQSQASSSNHLGNVAKRIAQNSAVLAFLPKVDLEVVVDANINELQVLLSQSKDFTKFIQDACERRLNDQIKSDDATALLKLYHRAKTETDNKPAS